MCVFLGDLGFVYLNIVFGRGELFLCLGLGFGGGGLSHFVLG